MVRLARLTVLGLLCLLPSLVHADSLKELLASFNAGRYEDVIDRATELLDAGQKPADAYQYLRGMAAYRIAWFGKAHDDLEPLGDYRLGQSWPSAAEAVDRIEQTRESLPRNVREIRSGGEVIFRVYYDLDDKWTSAIIKCLPDVHREVTDFFGPRLVETAVFIFAERENYDAFYKALCGKTPPAWQLASGGNGLLLFCRHAADPGYQVTPDTLPSVTAHEFSHCLTRRVLGNADFDVWLSEGLAEYLGSKFNQQDLVNNDSQITALLARKALLPIEVMTSQERFVADDVVHDAYAQAFAMVRFLVSDVGRDGVVQLLNALRHGATSGAAMEAVWEGGLPAFYDAWVAATEARVKRLNGGR